MNLRLMTLLITSAVCLSACACPRTTPYYGTPYEPDENERTAGTGFNEDQCWERTFL